MKLSAKFKAYALACICGVSASLIFIAAFDVFVMLAFNETGKHPIEFPSMLAVGAITLTTAAVCLCFTVKYINACERRRRMTLNCVLIFVITAAVSYIPWTFILWLFDSDARLIG